MLALVSIATCKVDPYPLTAKSAQAQKDTALSK